MADKRQKKKRESKGAYWMDTYGDMVTLLLTFFVMLFASSQINEAKWIRIVQSFTGEPAGALVEPIDPLNPTAGFAPSDYIPKVTPRDKEDLTAESDSEEKMEYDYKVEATFNELYSKLTQYIEEHNLGSTIIVEKDGQYIYITILEGILFDSGKADIKDETAETILNDLGNMIMESWDSVNMLKIEGHTDTDLIKQPAQFKDNRSLSSERANEVLRFLGTNCGMPNSDSIVTQGWGETRPVASNDTQEGKQQNRRVEFILESKNALHKGQ
ncbi:OmpA/MotB family protein [Christensenella intestinihominis]|uniref:OmpA/MotB family protein n=1 Tax=Christensenella intestinihominis TaxID=1851429 RepID=UPI00082E4063|nr:flagellar motor protein MotB [Christensenella intestinihominis]